MKFSADVSPEIQINIEIRITFYSRRLYFIYKVLLSVFIKSFVLELSFPILVLKNRHANEVLWDWLAQGGYMGTLLISSFNRLQLI